MNLNKWLEVQFVNQAEGDRRSGKEKGKTTDIYTRGHVLPIQVVLLRLLV